MPIFISYSHVDASFVDKLATALVKQNASVWVDRWELNVGDSILSRVQEAIHESDALLVVLSKASVASEWCKKELNAGLMRELDEKRVVVLPVLVEDCEIPIFLREKMYADFRKGFARGLKAISEAVAKLTNIGEGRFRSASNTIDWAQDWGYRDDGLFFLNSTLVEFSPDLPFTFLTEIIAVCNQAATLSYRDYEEAGLGWVGRLIIAESIAEAARERKLKLRLQDQFPQSMAVEVRDKSSSAAYHIFITSRRLGNDNGKDQLLTVGNYLSQIVEKMRRGSRKATEQELRRLKEISARHGTTTAT